MATYTRCRVCIRALDATVGSYDLRELPTLAHKFNACTDLFLDDDERVPSELCQVCHDQLEQLYEFRTKCIEAAKKWRTQIMTFPDAEKANLELDRAPPNTVDLEKLQPQQSSQANVRRRRRMIFQYNILQFEPVGEEMATSTKIEEEGDEMDSESSSSGQDLKSVHKCYICAAQFSNEKRLLTHGRHHGEMAYPCPEPGCERCYSRKHSLTLHTRKSHKLGKEYMLNAGIKNYTCSYCGVQKSTRTELKIHMNYHTMERTYSCHLCPKVCYSSSNLNEHMWTVHERARNHLCHFCDGALIHADKRNQQELIHTGEKPHECKCGRHFRQKAALSALESRNS